MTRRLLNLLAAVSLLLSAAVAVLWVRSRSGWDCFERQYWYASSRTYREYDIITSKGVLYLRLFRQDHDSAAAAADYAPYGYGKRSADFTSWWGHEFVGHAWDPTPKVFWPEARDDYERAGFFFTTNASATHLPDNGGMVTYACRTIACPIWSVIGVGALLPFLRLAIRAGSSARRRLRQTSGLCSRCGYDIRATPGRCPECGEGVARQRV